jgi:uncharacterized protein
MLAYNVAGLLGSSPGADRRYVVADAMVELPDDLQLAAPISGSVHLRRTDRSILADAVLRTALAETCSRCLRPVITPLEVVVSEEALPSVDFTTGALLDTSEEPDAFRIDAHHVLDLDGPVRDAIAMAEPIAPLCRPDCPGLCPGCGADLANDPGHAHPSAAVDPRLSPLAVWRPLSAASDTSAPSSHMHQERQHHGSAEEKDVPRRAGRPPRA